MAGVDGLGVAYATAGGILLWSGLKGQKVADLLHSLLAGNARAPVTETVSAPSVGGSYGAASAANAAADKAAAGVGASGPAPGADTSIANYSLARLVASTYGWGTGQQWACLTHVIAAESGGRAGAMNASGAYGIAQALGHGTAATAGTVTNQYGGYGVPDSTARAANSGNASAQLVWMMAYIKATYGTPCAAWATEQADHYY